MRQIIEWLIEIEKTAYALYIQSAALYDDPEIKTFLENAAQEESRHHRTMAKALETINEHPDLISEITLDQELKTRIETCFKSNQLKISDRSLSIESLIDCIVDTELSEWNHVFTYVVNSLKTVSPIFGEAAAGIQQHLKQVEHFLLLHPYGTKKISLLKELKPVWEDKILVVDDNPEILILLKAVLSHDGIVDTAENGKIALEKTRRTYYRLIISDVDMPVMDGMEFYRHATTEFPSIQQRIVFLTGDPSPERLDFFKKFNLIHLVKPVSIQQIRAVSLEFKNKISIAS